MPITPQTQVRLLKVPFLLDNKNQLTFSNLQAQTNYFTNLPYTTVDDDSEFQYQRKDNILRYPAHIDEIINYNYCMYKNDNYLDKWFYAFISNMRYLNDGTTEITLQTDTFQTWQFDLNYKKMFVEREHVSDDTIGKHTVPEGLELGDYIVDNCIHDDTLNEVGYMIQSTKTTTGTDMPKATNYGGTLFPGGAYFTTDPQAFINIIEGITPNDAIYNAYMVPSAIVNDTDQTLRYSGQALPVSITISKDKPATLNGYTPKNKKLLTFPYCFLNVSNNNGTVNSLKYELFHDTEGQFYFIIKGVPVPGGSIKLLPINYGNSEIQNEDEGIMAGKFPALAWEENTYTNWLTQNGVNLSVGVSKEVLGTTAGKPDLDLMDKLTTNISGKGITTIGGAFGIGNKMQEVYARSLVPYTVRGNTNGGDINVCSNRNGFSFYFMSIKREFAEIIDDFFNSFRL